MKIKLFTLFVFTLISIFAKSQNKYYDFRERTSGERIHILYMSGGDWHDNLEVASILRKFLENRHEYYITYSEDYSIFTRTLNDYDVILINGMPSKIKEDQLKGLIEAVRNGKPLLGIHSATAAFKKVDPKQRDQYVDMIGAKFKNHPAIYNFSAVITKKDHQITKSIGDFNIYDEMYFYDEIRDGSKTLIEAQHEGQTTPIAWTRVYGKGKVFYTSLGHGVGATTNRYFQQLILNGLLWLTKEE